MRERQYLVVAVPSPKLSDGVEVVNCAPYGGALVPNVRPGAVDVVAGIESPVTVVVDAGVPKVNGAAGCWAGACGVVEAPNAKPVLVCAVVCGVPNVKPDILFFFRF